MRRGCPRGHALHGLRPYRVMGDSGCLETSIIFIGTLLCFVV